MERERRKRIAFGENDHEKLHPELSGGVDIVLKTFSVPSSSLNRDVRIDIYVPSDFDKNAGNRSVLLFNDGQDLTAVGLKSALKNLFNLQVIAPLAVVGIYPAIRIQEYGVIGIADYKGRGAKAREYSDFVISELLPFLKKYLSMHDFQKRFSIAGFSLGGLSAFDIAWNYPDYFQNIGVFSGSFWWRSRKVRKSDPDADRIMHNVINQSVKKPGLRFWLQTGTLDEYEDRNNNGIIDSIDDTLDIIKSLREKGYENKDIRYVELEGGEHCPATWKKVLPDFLIWAFGKEK